MKEIIVPPHKKISTPVERYKDIKADATAMVKNIREDKYDGGPWKTAYAIAHAQVSHNPKTFFVVNTKLPEIRKKFKHSVIINPKILKKNGEVFFREACMSLPYTGTVKMRRYEKIKVEYKVPVLFGLMLWTKKRTLEGLPSFIMQHEIDHFGAKYLDKKLSTA